MFTCGDDHTRPTWLCNRIERFTRGLDDYIAGRALSDYSRQFTVPQPGRWAPAADQHFYTADFADPDRWWIVGADGKPPRESSRYERAQVASLAVQNAIRAAAHATDDQHRDQPSDAQAAMPQEYLEGSTTDPATWMRTPANLKRLAAITRAADARRHALEDREFPAPIADPVDPRRQEHEQQHPQPGPQRGQGPGPGQRT
ncbi:hypothetical protein ABT382_24850 [Streptomyces pharetrae]|uniref:hypothetical protein n=1 Tax=Streptomyces pharetrae TaxID=291370 RepID=UPI0033605A48